MAALEGLEGFDPDRLFEPEVNLRLGTRYLGELTRQFGSVEAAVAAYNAGEEKVGEWWRAFEADRVDDPAERVARIPYRETRNYVRRVLEAAAWYRWLSVAPGAIEGDPARGG